MIAARIVIGIFNAKGVGFFGNTVPSDADKLF